MAVWAIAWAGSKPLASLADGLLAGQAGLKLTGVLLALPALVPVGVLIFMTIVVQDRWTWSTAAGDAVDIADCPAAVNMAVPKPDPSAGSGAAGAGDRLTDGGA